MSRLSWKRRVVRAVKAALEEVFRSRPQAAERYRPSSAPYYDACAALTKLEQAILGPASTGR